MSKREALPAKRDQNDVGGPQIEHISIMIEMLSDTEKPY